MVPRLGRRPTGSPTVEATVEENESTGTVVITAVAAVSDVPIVELPPLYETVDMDALDALFHEGTTTGNVVFEYDDAVVVVTADGRVQVYDEETD